MAGIFGTGTVDVLMASAEGAFACGLGSGDTPGESSDYDALVGGWAWGTAVYPLGRASITV